MVDLIIDHGLLIRSKQQYFINYAILVNFNEMIPFWIQLFFPPHNSYFRGRILTNLVHPPGIPLPARHILLWLVLAGRDIILLLFPRLSNAFFFAPAVYSDPCLAIRSQDLFRITSRSAEEVITLLFCTKGQRHENSPQDQKNGSAIDSIKIHDSPLAGNVMWANDLDNHSKVVLALKFNPSRVLILLLLQKRDRKNVLRENIAILEKKGYSCQFFWI